MKLDSVCGRIAKMNICSVLMLIKVMGYGLFITV